MYEPSLDSDDDEIVHVLHQMNDSIKWCGCNINLSMRKYPSIFSTSEGVKNRVAEIRIIMRRSLIGGAPVRFKHLSEIDRGIGMSIK